jgi:prepilin-type N-terminal cleavage/methylation domain-containing protein
MSSKLPCWKKNLPASMPRGIAGKGRRGFSMIELLVVVSIVLLVVSLSVPALIQGVHTARLKGAGSDLSGLLQVARIRAVRDDRYYSVYLLNNNGLQQMFVDIYPQNVNGASGSGGTALNFPDPSISLTTEITRQPQSAAPNIANLAQQLLPTNPNNLVPADASVALTPFTFGPEGLPCKPVVVPGGTVCNSHGGAVAYWTFLQNNITQAWEALTVTPAGRIQQWYYSNGIWNAI